MIAVITLHLSKFKTLFGIFETIFENLLFFDVDLSYFPKAVNVIQDVRQRMLSN